MIDRAKKYYRAAKLRVPSAWPHHPGCTWERPPREPASGLPGPQRRPAERPRCARGSSAGSMLVNWSARRSCNIVYAANPRPAPVPAPRFWQLHIRRLTDSLVCYRAASVHPALARSNPNRPPASARRYIPIHIATQPAARPRGGPRQGQRELQRRRRVPVSRWRPDVPR